MYVSCTRKNHGVFEVRSVQMQYGHTTTLLFEYCRRSTQSDDTAPTGFQDVCARNTKPKPEGSIANAKVSTCTCYCCDQNWRCSNVTTVICFCGVGVFTSPAPMSASCGSSESLKLRKITIVGTIYQSTSMTRPTTNSSTSHSIETAKKMGVLVALPACGYPPAILFLLTFSDNSYR